MLPPKSQQSGQAKLFSPQDALIRRIHNQIAYLATIGLPTPGLALVRALDREQLSNLIETAFWASLLTNEGRPIRVSLSVAATVPNPQVVRFKPAISYERSEIAKIAPAVPPGGTLLVAPSESGWIIWGFIGSHIISMLESLDIDLVGTGTVRLGVGPFQPFAILTGDSNSIIESSRIGLAAYLQRVLHKSLPAKGDISEDQAVFRECMAVAGLARTIVKDAHGGAVLIVPSETGDWSNCVTVPFRLEPPDTSIRDAIRHGLKKQEVMGRAFERVWAISGLSDEDKSLITGELAQPRWYPDREVRAIASMASVDGAILMTRDLIVLGFGAKIIVNVGSALQVAIYSPGPENQEPTFQDLDKIGGTRHQSAANFVAANKAALALVISQDGRLSVMHWYPPTQTVAIFQHAEWLG